MHASSTQNIRAEHITISTVSGCVTWNISQISESQSGSIQIIFTASDMAELAQAFNETKRMLPSAPQRRPETIAAHKAGA